MNVFINLSFQLSIKIKHMKTEERLDKMVYLLKVLTARLKT